MNHHSSPFLTLRPSKSPSHRNQTASRWIGNSASGGFSGFHFPTVPKVLGDSAAAYPVARAFRLVGWNMMLRLMICCVMTMGCLMVRSF